VSRIHEALRKAAEEKTRQGVSVPVTDANLVDLTAHGSSAGLIDETRLPSSFTAESTARSLRFEELIKHCAHPTWRINSQLSAFRDAAETPVEAERFRTLRGRLYQISDAQPLKRLLVTSSLPAEGKTFIASNLAQSIVQQPDQRVLLIDADLRLSQMHVLLGAPKGPGLADYLAGTADEYAVLQHGSEGNLCFIASGSDVSNPSELLMNGRFKQLLERFTPAFDWIVIDSPPALPVHDASIIAAECDGVLFVVRSGVTRHDSAAKATTEFEDGKLLGVVLNAVTGDPAYGNYYYYHYSYGSQKKAKRP
jgi:protein-tyrosine kinase